MVGEPGDDVVVGQVLRQRRAAWWVAGDLLGCGCSPKTLPGWSGACWRGGRAAVVACHLRVRLFGLGLERGKGVERVWTYTFGGPFRVHGRARDPRAVHW